MSKPLRLNPRRHKIEEVVQLLEQAKAANDTWAIKTWQIVLDKLKKDADNKNIRKSIAFK